jgi:glycerophosphoryl diester phosphodiesterase
MVKIYAHRGCTRDHPESTRPALAAALEYGVDGIELDLRLSSDGKAMVIHDDRIDRTSDGSGAVDDLSLVQLKALDAGGWFSPRFAGERFLTLAEALDLAGDRLEINIHLKPAGAGVERLLDQAIEVIDASQRAGRDYLSCDPASFQTARRLRPDLRLCYLGPQPRNTPAALATACQQGSCNMQVPHHQIDAGFVTLAHQHNMAINAIYIGPGSNDLDEMKRLVACGIDGLLLDHAESWLEHSDSGFGPPR